ncbi:MAG TPA: hypothetical protein VFR04_02535 [Solirubrobacterales bacterium]|nr:hypothetical protein [Solirubrobacterales bacterium]
MGKRLAITLAAACLAALLLVPSAQAAFSVTGFDVAYEDQNGLSSTDAGSHPYAMTTQVEFSTKEGAKPGEVLPDGSIKDLTAELPTGLVGDRAAVPFCSTADFLEVPDGISNCPDNTAVGVLSVHRPGEPPVDLGPAFNLDPPPGAAAKIGFILLQVPVALLIRVSPAYPHNLVATLKNTADVEPIGGSTLTIWGNPASSSHDKARGHCLSTAADDACPVDLEERPFLTLPRACTGDLFTTYLANSWEEPQTLVSGASESALRTINCGNLPFGPTITAKPTTLAAQSPTGLDFSLDVKDAGLQSPEGTANSDVRRAVVTLPEGMTVNPSIAEGLEVCTKAQLAKETVNSAPGEGCPNASKIGTVEVETPLLDENVNGAIFQAPQDDPATTEPGAENPFDSLIALNMVIKNPELGIIVKQAIEVRPDPVTGRLTTVADDIPQLPFSHFRLKFREGTRSPLASPPGCGTYRAEALLFPWSGNAPVPTDSAFSIVTGPGGGACPSGGVPPFHPGLMAGTLNNAAGSYSPFDLRLFRNDGEQEFTHFSIKLPPGLLGKLAGISFCPEAAIALAKTKTANAELAEPSCPKASEVGRTLVGAGVGPSLAYAPGKLYLAGPYNGSALSIAAITAAKVGPFELGTVVVREALKVDPETAEVFVDATGSDPIPHILRGIPVHARDIRVYVDRPNFVLNPTSCKRTSTASTVLGSGADFGSEADNVPVTVTSPFQAADCASLGFKPKLAISLQGGTKRGENPKLKAVLTARPGDANTARAQVTLPHSAFLDQAHIKTICTRVQFAQGAFPGEKCPKGSIYGYAKAITPLLDEPVQGPVYLRSSSHPLPDLVAALHSGRIDVNLVGRIDSVKGGQIRTTFAAAPDAPVKTFTLTMQGGNKGLLVNSTDLCRSVNKAKADFTGHNGKRHVFAPVVKPDCGKARKKPGRK